MTRAPGAEGSGGDSLGAGGHGRQAKGRKARNPLP